MPGIDKPAAMFLREDRRAKLEVGRTDFGVRNYAIRDAGDGGRYVASTTYSCRARS